MASDLAKKYAPDFFMDKLEPYMPCTYADLIRNSQVVDTSGRIIVEKISDPNVISNYDNSYRLKLDKDARRGMIDVSRYPSKLEIYCMEKNLKYGDVDKDPSYICTDIYYIMLFAYNGTFESHDTDMEFVMIRFINNNPIAMYFSHHSGGYWRPWSDILKTPRGNPIVFSAIESHAFFDRPGVYPRVLGFGNDKVDPTPTPLTYNESYDLVMAGSQSDLKQRPYMGSRIGRTPVDSSSFFYNWSFDRPQKRASPTDYSGLIREKIGPNKIAVAMMILFLILSISIVHLVDKKEYVSVIIAITAFLLGLSWMIAASPSEISNTPSNLTF